MIQKELSFTRLAITFNMYGRASRCGYPIGYGKQVKTTCFLDNPFHPRTLRTGCENGGGEIPMQGRGGIEAYLRLLSYTTLFILLFL